MSNVRETRRKYDVIVDGKPVLKFYSNQMVENMVYKTGNGDEYLCKENQFIKLNSSNHDTHRNFN